MFTLSVASPDHICQLYIMKLCLRFLQFPDQVHIDEGLSATAHTH